MREEKVLTLRGKRAVWAPGGGSGPIDPKRLPEGYPYKEQSETVLLEETTVQQETMYKPFTLPFFEITPGTIYDVIWDGEHYSCEAYYAEHPGLGAINVLGDLTATGFESGNGEPFAIFSAASQTGVYAFDVDAHTVSISGITETIHPMNEEFIRLTSPNGTKYQLTVADDGTLSAVAVS